MIQSVVALDLASVATLVMWAKDFSSAYPSSSLSRRALPVAASFAYWSATSVPSAPACAGTQAFLAVYHEHPTQQKWSPKQKRIYLQLPLEHIGLHLHLFKCAGGLSRTLYFLRQFPYLCCLIHRLFDGSYVRKVTVWIGNYLPLLLCPSSSNCT